MTKYRHTNRKVRELENEIKFINKSLDFSARVNKLLQMNYDKADKERINYRRIIKYSTMLMLLMNLITSNSGDTDVDKIFNHNINEFYKTMNNDLMQIPTNDNEGFEDDEGYDESESSDIWDGEEEFE